MKQRFGYVLIVVVTIAAFVVARRNYKATTNERGTVTIRISHFTIDPHFRSFLDKAGAEYEKRHPGVRIKQLDIPRQVYLQWQRTQIIGEMAPEIMQFAYFNPGVEDMVMHRFAVLDPWVEKPNPYDYREGTKALPWRDTFRDGLNSRDAYSSKLRAYFGIPLIMGGYRFFYNQNMREEKIGGDHPWTFHEFRSLGEQLVGTDVGGGQVMPMASSDYSSYTFFKMLFASMTQSMLFKLDRNYDLKLSGRDTSIGFLEGRWNYHTEEVQAGFRLMRDGAALMNPGFGQLRKDNGVAEFAQGRALSLGGAHIDISYLKQLAEFEIGESGFPVPDQSDPEYGKYVLGPVNELQGSSTVTLGVLRSPLQDQAVDFLQFLTGTDMMALLLNETGWRVAVKDADLGLNLKAGYPDSMYDIFNSRGNILAYGQNQHLLFQRDGGAEVLADKLNEESPSDQRVWLKAQATTLRQTLRQQEAAILARWVLARKQNASVGEDKTMAEFLRVNNRQETEFRKLNRFMKKHAEP